MELEHTKSFLGLSCHFTAKSTDALLLTIVGSFVTSSACYKKIFEVLFILVRCVRPVSVVCKNAGLSGRSV
jgi:uncharacterized membrane protein YczE